MVTTGRDSGHIGQNRPAGIVQLNANPMSVAFLCAAEETRVREAAPLSEQHSIRSGNGQRLVRLTPPVSWTIWLAQLADERALVQAGADIDTGCEAFLPDTGLHDLPEAPWIVASINRTTRAAKNEWLITWAGSERSIQAGAPIVQAQLAPDWFAQWLLRWIHETARTDGAAVDLIGFAGMTSLSVRSSRWPTTSPPMGWSP
jgi:hypothetical protein